MTKMQSALLVFCAFALGGILSARLTESAFVSRPIALHLTANCDGFEIELDGASRPLREAHR